MDADRLYPVNSEPLKVFKTLYLSIEQDLAIEFIRD